MTKEKETDNQPAATDKEDIPSDEIHFVNTLASLLDPYVPAASEFEADEVWSTPEIIKALETHYGIPQGESTYMQINGVDLVNKLIELGYRPINIGALQLVWVFKKKSKQFVA